MKRISDILVDVIDTLLEQQPAEEKPHCVQRQADLYAGMDEMGSYAEASRAPARITGSVACE